MERSRATGGSFLEAALLPAVTPRWIDTRVSHGAGYVYRVVAVDRDGLWSAPSVQVTAFPLGPPLPPLGLGAQAEGGRVRLRWQASAQQAVTTYVVYQRRAFVLWTEVTRVRDAEAVLSGFDSGQVITLRVTAVESHGLESAPSEPVSVTVSEFR